MDYLPEAIETESSNSEDMDVHKKCNVVVQMIELNDYENEFDLTNLNGRADDDYFYEYKNLDD